MSDGAVSWVFPHRPEVDFEDDGRSFWKREAIMQAILGHTQSLTYAFRWSCTPQGREYWELRESGKERLTLGDVEQLMAWYALFPVEERKT